MGIKAYIFDFDGTLVHSNEIKRAAFYSISPHVTAHSDVVDKILAEIPERSRFEIIGRIFEIISIKEGRRFSENDVQAAIGNYSSTVRAGVMACPELEGATPCLQTIHRLKVPVMVSSNTPEEFLGELIAARNWTRYIHSYFGYPRKKEDTVASVLNSFNFAPSEVLIIGDGSSDEQSARINKCQFFKVTHDRSLMDLHRRILETK